MPVSASASALKFTDGRFAAPQHLAVNRMAAHSIHHDHMGVDHGDHQALQSNKLMEYELNIHVSKATARMALLIAACFLGVDLIKLLGRLLPSRQSVSCPPLQSIERCYLERYDSHPQGFRWILP